jgi:hypothetical protein
MLQHGREVDSRCSVNEDPVWGVRRNDQRIVFLGEPPKQARVQCQCAKTITVASETSLPGTRSLHATQDDGHLAVVGWEQRCGLDGDSESAKRKILRADGFCAERLVLRLLCVGDKVLLGSVRRSGPDGDRDIREYTTAEVDGVLVPLSGDTPIDGEGTVLKDVGALCRPRSAWIWAKSSAAVSTRSPA